MTQTITSLEGFVRKIRAVNRRLIARYEALLAEGLSSCSAVTVLVREFRLSNRQVEKIVNGPSPVGVAMEMVAQGCFFNHHGIIG